MANTTFSGPVRSENGFEQVSKNATTGVYTDKCYLQCNYSQVEFNLYAGAGAVDLTNLITEVTIVLELMH